MVDLSVEMAELWASLGAPAPGRARVVMVTAARRKEGVSTVARELARFAAQRAGRTTWLVDLDLPANPQAAAVAAEPELYGKLSAASAASPDGSMFLTVQPPQRTKEGATIPDAKYVQAHKLGDARFFVTRFRREVLKGSQKPHVLPSADYWNALRKHADVIVVDAPSADRSQAAMALAPFVDATILVVSADQPDVRAPAQLRDAIMGAGGRVAGVFFNRAQVEPPAFLRKILS